MMAAFSGIWILSLLIKEINFKIKLKKKLDPPPPPPPPLTKLSGSAHGKLVNNFIHISFNVCFGCSKCSFDYTQQMFWLRNKKITF